MLPPAAMLNVKRTQVSVSKRSVLMQSTGMYMLRLSPKHVMAPGRSPRSGNVASTEQSTTRGGTTRKESLWSSSAYETATLSRAFSNHLCLMVVRIRREPEHNDKKRYSVRLGYAIDTAHAYTCDNVRAQA